MAPFVTILPETRAVGKQFLLAILGLRPPVPTLDSVDPVICMMSGEPDVSARAIMEWVRKGRILDRKTTITNNRAGPGRGLSPRCVSAGSGPGAHGDSLKRYQGRYC